MEETAHLVEEHTILLSVLNGIQSEEDLGRRFGREKGSALYSAENGCSERRKHCPLQQQGRTGHRYPAGGRAENPGTGQSFFEQTGFAYVCPEDIRHAMWSKLLCNVGVNQTVALCGGTYRSVQQEGELRELMKDAMQEVIAIANREGVALSEADRQQWLDVIDSLNPDGEPSMRQDVKAGRATEIALLRVRSVIWAGNTALPHR